MSSSSSLHAQFIRSYLLFKVIHDISEISDDYDELCRHFALNFQLIHSIHTTCYLCGHHLHILMKWKWMCEAWWQCMHAWSFWSVARCCVMLSHTHGTQPQSHSQLQLRTASSLWVQLLKRLLWCEVPTASQKFTHVVSDYNSSYNCCNAHFCSAGIVVLCGNCNVAQKL